MHTDRFPGRWIISPRIGVQTKHAGGTSRLLSYEAQTVKHGEILDSRIRPEAPGSLLHEVQKKTPIPTPTRLPNSSSHILFFLRSLDTLARSLKQQVYLWVRDTSILTFKYDWKKFRLTSWYGKNIPLFTGCYRFFFRISSINSIGTKMEHLISVEHPLSGGVTTPPVPVMPWMSGQPSWPVWYGLGLPPTQDASHHQDYYIFSRESL